MEQLEQAVTQIGRTAEVLSNGIIPISTLYIGINVLLNLILALLVVRARVQTGVEIGDGGKEELIKAQRVQGNNAEYVPFALLVLIAVEIAAAPVWLVHTLGAGLSVSRVAHAFGLSQSTGRSAGRFLGTIGTWLVMLAGGIACIYYGLR